MTGQVLLTFDVEEFDIPLEYNYPIRPEEQLAIGKTGLDQLTPLLNHHTISSTLFTTANFALHFPEDIKSLADLHEIASHTFYHSSFDTGHLLSSKQALEKITGKTVTGLRMPRMQNPDMDEVKRAGYKYDSSIHPTWLPGRYNNLSKPRVIFTEMDILRLPASVSPVLRLPLFWLAFKNYPYSFFRNICIKCLEKDGYVCLYFHPWEFTDIHNFNLPGYVKKLCGQPLLERLDRLIADLKKDYGFSTVENYLNSRH